MISNGLKAKEMQSHSKNNHEVCIIWDVIGSQWRVAMTTSYTTPGPAGGAGQVFPDRKGIPRATSFFGCIFLKQVRRGREKAGCVPRAGRLRGVMQWPARRV